MSYGAVLDWFDALASGDDQRRGWSSGVGNGGDEEEDEETLGKLRRMGRVFWRWISQVWIDPTQEAVRKVVGSWYCRWGILVVFPAMLVSPSPLFFLKSRSYPLFFFFFFYFSNKRSSC